MNSLFHKICIHNIPDSKVHGGNIGPTWVLSAPGGPHVGPMNLAILDIHIFLCFVWFWLIVSSWIDLHTSCRLTSLEQGQQYYYQIPVKYRKLSNISRTLVGNKIVDHSDVVGASPVGAAPTTSFFNLTPGFSGLGKDNSMTRRETFMFWEWVRLILESWR